MTITYLCSGIEVVAEAGKTVSEAASALKMHIKRVQLIASENGFTFPEPSQGA